MRSVRAPKKALVETARGQRVGAGEKPGPREASTCARQCASASSAAPRPAQGPYRGGKGRSRGQLKLLFEQKFFQKSAEVPVKCQDSTNQKRRARARRPAAKTSNTVEAVPMSDNEVSESLPQNNGKYDYRPVECSRCGWRGRRGYRVTWPACPQCLAHAQNIKFVGKRST
jgi:hypothetical protein